MGFKRVGVFIVVGVLLFGGGFIANSIVNKPTPATSGQTDYSSYPFLAKRLFLENPNENIINFSPLRQSVRKYFSDNQLNGSLYFEYLPTGTSVRVNGDQEYRAASLIKLPVAMELYKAHELGKLQLDQKVTLKQEWLNDSYGNLYKKGTGYELTLEEAVRIMLVDSDNTALRVVIDATDKVLDLNNRALGSLDIEFTQSSDEGINIGTRSYSSFLKCLYFACYNDKEHSQEILKLLTETGFNNRIVAGISDKDVKVAHKIGVFNTQVQSDCGIVYLPNGNYVLCAMIVGNDNDATNKHVANISKIVFDYVKKSSSK